MLFAKRDLRDQNGQSLGQRFSNRFGRYLAGHHPTTELVDDEQVIDINACYALLGEAHTISPAHTTELQPLLHRIIALYEKQTGHWLDPEQVALAAIKYDVQNQANILRHHFPDHHPQTSTLHCTGHHSYLLLTLLADALKITHFSLDHPTPCLIKPSACRRNLNVLLDETSMADIESHGRELRETCTRTLIQSGADPDALHTCWHLRMRYADSSNSLLLKCMPIDLLREVFESQHKQQFGFNALDQAILIEALEIEITLQTPCQPGSTANSVYVQQLMSQWQADQTTQPTTWTRILNPIAASDNTDYLDCPILAKMLAQSIAQPLDLAMSDFLLKNEKRG